jgi:O-6-methylguanine DNA methyltransferase
MSTDPLLAGLAGLATDPPRSIVDAVYTGWVAADSAVGTVYVAFTDRGVSYLRTAASVESDVDEFTAAYRARFGRPVRRADRAPVGLLPALAGRAHRTLRVDLSGLTDFQRDVLAVTARIPSGQIRPYAWVAREVGRPKAVRAVGTALATNPVPVLVPCHRVTPSGGEPGNYVFGPVLKERLLRAEHVDLDTVRALAGRSLRYVGSDTTGIFCFPTCAHAHRITPAHRRAFRGSADAVAAGYRSCLVCRPN